MMRETKRGAPRAAAALALAIALAATSALAGGDVRLSGTVNVNTASAEQLQLLPGIGATRAAALIDARKRRGGFQRVEDLLEVQGIGEASLERIRPFVSVEGKTTAQLE
ncbi:MAG: helix-hairpin-helix domain-containing protein [Myxococcales bacterium]|nr:helix-hairpin-helix domain-containing protein [Myxococcales bacterium]MDH5307398.1 helix-hairpin-helix domain-containing protein [Myxococcales bacterium]MDH5567566.1 helix-hairpin-helix domain-containing protein [Myxococcales bacterium]